MKFIKVGTIIGTHGIKGEVKVKSDTSFKENRYKKNNILYLDYQNEMKEIMINSYRSHKNIDLITFNNLNNINDVIQYINCEIFVDKDSIINNELEENEYYYDDLIGLKVFDQEGKEYGEVIDITEVPQGELIVLKKLDGTESLIPFVDEFILEVNIEEEKLIINPIEGLI